MSMDEESTGKDDTESDDDIVVEVALVDIDGDGVVDAAVTRVTESVDIAGDGRPDIVVVTEVAELDIDGDGVADVVETWSDILGK